MKARGKSSGIPRHLFHAVDHTLTETSSLSPDSSAKSATSGRARHLSSVPYGAKTTTIAICVALVAIQFEKMESLQMKKKILTIVSNHGYWGVELTGPMVKLEKAGYELVFATPKGERPVALPPSYDTAYFDPPLGVCVCVTTPEDAAQVKSIMDSPKLDRPKLDRPINLSGWFPERPFFSEKDFLRAWENYFRTVRQRWQELDDYAGMLLVGGSGPIVDMVNNQRVHDVILGFHQVVA